jgi:hypothetical protein
MLARLGHAVYWLCSVFAVVIAGFGIAGWYDRFSQLPNGLSIMFVFASATAIVWTIGRASRYVLAGE